MITLPTLSDETAFRKCEGIDAPPIRRELLFEGKKS